MIWSHQMGHINSRTCKVLNEAAGHALHKNSVKANHNQKIDKDRISLGSQIYHLALKVATS